MIRRSSMMPKHEMDKAVEIAKKYGIGELYLIGSALYKEPEDVYDLISGSINGDRLLLSGM